MSEHKYLHKEWLKTLNRVTDNNPERGDKDKNEIRLHRAERLNDFPDSFYNDIKVTINQEDIRLYPDTSKLKNKISQVFNIDSDNVLLFAGSLVGIKTFMELFCLSTKSVLITKECFPMHFLFPKMQDTNIIYINHKIISNNNNILKMQIDFDSLIENITNDICCICISNPNSPLGDTLTLNQIEQILIKAELFRIPVLIDEAYIEFSNATSCVPLLSNYHNLVISRTFSKACGLAGLRAGYLLTSKNISNSMNKIMYPYEISHITSIICCKLLDSMHLVNDYVNSIKIERQKIFDICLDAKVKYLDCQLNTIHLRPKNLTQIYEHYLKNNVKCKCRKINTEDYLCLSIYIGFSESKLFKSLVNFHNKY